MTPRTPFASVAYAHRVSTVDGSTGGAITGDVDITSSSGGNAFSVTQTDGGRGGYFQISNASNSEAAVQGTHVGPGPGGSFFSDGGGPGIRASASGGLAADLQGRVDTYGDLTTFDGVDSAVKVDVSAKQISTFGNDGLEQVRIWGSSYGEMQLHDNSGNDITALLSATSNGGGALQLMDELGTIQLSLAGGNSGDASANFPVDAINADETLEEAGIANRIQGSSVNVAGTADILIRTITTPTSGYVIAMASAWVEHLHLNGAFSQMRIYVIPTGGSSSNAPYTQTQISSFAPSGTYHQSMSCIGVFSVSAGANQFILQANNAGGNTGLVYDGQLTLLFVPTAYGVVTSNLNPTPPVGHETPDQESANAKLFNEQRIKGELAELRARLDELSSKIESQEVQ